MNGTELYQRIVSSLANTHPQAPGTARRPGVGDLAGVDTRIRPRRIQPAAVLVPLVRRGDALTVLLTERAAHLKHHPGQVSFPGGRVEPGDQGPLDTALRETEEEIGLMREHVEVLGYLDNYFTITGYTVTPVVGLIDHLPPLTLDPSEVAEAFEVPLAHVFDVREHRRRVKHIMGVSVPIYEIVWQQRRIWGATAAMIVGFSARVQKEN